MSYILDALKKSEKERSLGKVRTLGSSDQPQARGVPVKWFVLTVAFLVAVLAAVIVWMGWLPRPGAVPAAATAPAGESTPTVRAPAAADTVEEEGAAALEPVPLAALDSVTRARLPSVEVNVLSFSESRPRRFVMIGQQIFKEGETVAEGLVVAEIRNSDVVFDFEGVRFIVHP